MDEHQSDPLDATPSDTPLPDAADASADPAPETGTASGDPIAALSFEEALRQLEAVVHRLEGGEATLDESIRLYEQGDRLRRRCADRLDEAQARVESIRLDAEGRPAGTRPFAAA